MASKRESCVVKKAKLPLNHQLKASASLKQAFDSYLGVTRHMLTLTNLVDVVRVGSENIHFLPVAGTTMYGPAVLLWQGGHRAKHPAMQPAKLWRQEATAVPSHGDAPQHWSCVVRGAVYASGMRKSLLEKHRVYTNGCGTINVVFTYKAFGKVTSSILLL